jgi:ADP-heptose:LPS heptosyltransferase
MKPQTIKKLDKAAGKSICLILTMYNGCLKFFRGKRDKTCAPEKILFIKLIEQGATVVAFSAIKRAVEMVGAANVYFLVFADNKPILDIMNVIPSANIFTIRNKGIMAFSADILKTLVKIRKIRIDTTIDMEFFSRFPAIFSFFSGARNRIGYHRYLSELPYRGNLMTHKIQYNPYTHVALAYLLMVESLKSEHKKDVPMPKIDEGKLKITPYCHRPATGEIELIQRLISDELKSELLTPIILLNPNSSDMIPLRKWDTNNFIVLAQDLIRHFKHNLTIIITGAPDEMDSGEAIAAAINSPRCISLAGKTSLTQLMALYAASDVLLTNDSGPGHFASMTPIHDIVLFGPETPKLYGPVGENVHFIESGLSCRPCVNHFNHRFSPCNDNLCMKAISVVRVFSKILEVLNLEATEIYPKLEK